MRTVLKGLLQGVFVAGLLIGAAAYAQTPQQSSVLFQNVRVFNGTGSTLPAPSNVLVKGNKIAKISTAPIPVDRSASMRIIDGDGRTLMPGLIDDHVHLAMQVIPMPVMLVADRGYIDLLAGKAATDTLMRGFTSVRDMAGDTFGIKRAIDTGVIPGPRIWPSGAMISQSGGHGDFRLPFEMPASLDAPLSRGEQLGGGIIADGVPQVLKRVREQLALGASQIKLAAGGGVSSNYDPIDVTQYTEPELRAAVEAAANWGTYVSVHAYTPKAIQTAIRAGVEVIEHGQLMDDATAKMMAKHGTWLSTQPFIDNEFANPQKGAARIKQQEVFAGTDNMFKLAKKYKLKVAFGTDTLFDPKIATDEGAILATMTRWYTPAEVLKMATSTNAKLLALSGPRNPYPGKLGVVQEGALADLLLVDGNPLKDIQLLADPAKNFVVIMKDGKIYKDTLH